MQIETETTVRRPVQEVFDYIAHAEYLPEYLEDFESVQQETPGDPGIETMYSYRMKRGAGGTFKWTRFEPASYLAWEGLPVKLGPGSMRPRGWWELSDTGRGTRVKLVMAPIPGGLFKLLGPFMAAAMSRGNAAALTRLKQRLESGAASA